MGWANRGEWAVIAVCLMAFPMTLSGAPEGRPEAVAVLDARFGTRTAPIFLLVRPDVQSDLKLDARRAAEAEAAIAQLIERALGLKDRSGPEVEEDRRRIDEEMTNWLAAALSPAQIERLRQINLQWEAASALTRPHMIELLRLTREQRMTVGRILGRQEAARSARGRISSREAARFLEEATVALTPSQRRLWTRSLGPPCRFSIGDPPAGPNVAGPSRTGEKQGGTAGTNGRDPGPRTGP